VLANTEPKVFPVSAAARPKGTNMTTRPSTNTAESASACQRDLAFEAPNTLTVMAIIGYTQGVKLDKRPEPYAASVIATGRSASAASNVGAALATAGETTATAPAARAARRRVHVSPGAPRVAAWGGGGRGGAGTGMIMSWGRTGVATDP
jgi:hypothetical protein